MKKTIVNIAPAVAETPCTKRVAAYARVSCGKDTMLHSLAAQIDYYRNYIMMNPEWRFAGVYADESKTGTKDNREQFQLLLTECRSGNIDMVITKSISRFARNTVTLLETVRELKSLGVDVFFEEQNIYTLSAEGRSSLLSPRQRAFRAATTANGESARALRKDGHPPAQCSDTAW